MKKAPIVFAGIFFCTLAVVSAAPEKRLELLSAGNVKIKALARLGDKAARASEGAENGPSRVVMLYVAKGNAFITVGIGGVDDEKAIARKIVAHL